MNLLLKYYIEKNSVEEWAKRFSSAGQDLIMYSFKGTNGRTLTNFYKKFIEFSEVEGIPRSDWPKKDTGQEIYKQYTVPMLESRLFYAENGIYYKTAKGKIYEEFLNLDLNSDEKWFLTYLFLLDSTIDNHDNYILNRSNEVYELLSKATAEQFVDKSLADLFVDRNNYGQDFDIAFYDYLYLNVFYLEPDFLNIYYNSSEEDREELKEYVSKNLKEKNRKCCICQKFVAPSLTTGNYSIPELLDDLKIMMFSLLVDRIQYTNFENTIALIIKMYASDYNIDVGKINTFIMNNKNIFEPILINVFKVEESSDLEEDNEIVNNIDTSSLNININESIDIPEPRVDDTTIEGKQFLKNIFAMRKKIAREKSNYKCELEQYKGCRYFTSKTTNHNYVEVHHFVPREFRNNYENSIDVLANYITLCPHCHKMIHLATDRERIDAIRYIFNQRKDRLESCGLHVELEDVLNYYNIDNK